jgi:hypothetical protein
VREQLRSELESEERVAALTSGPAQPSDVQGDLSAAQLASLSDEAKQAEYHRQYLLQMQRRSCPACGDSPMF